MDMNNLVSGVSNVTLDQVSHEKPHIHEPRKSRRPIRAFHSFETESRNLSRSPVPTVPNSPRLSPSIPQTGATIDEVFQNLQTPSHVIRGPGMKNKQSTSSHFVSPQRFEDQIRMLKRTYLTRDDSVPPLSTSQYYAADQGFCDPRLMSLSMYNIPIDDQLRSATKLPVGVTLQPFAKMVPDDVVPTVNYISSPSGPLRCRRCRAYINPRFQFAFDSSMICNLCLFKSQVTEEQNTSVLINGQAIDVNEKLELTKGTVDFLVPKSYNISEVNEPVPLHYVFLIDISAFANENKSSLAAIEAIRSCIDYMIEHQPNCKVAIIAYDEWIRFYNLRSDLEQTQEYLITDVNDVFLPLNKGLFALPMESMHVIQDLLVKLETYIVDEKYSHRSLSCFGSAVEAARLALHSATRVQGGKIIATLNTLPTKGLGNLSLTRDEGLKKHLRCENEYYKKLASDLLTSWVGLDLFVTSAAFIDLATTAYPVLVTSGQLHYYSNFNINNDEFKFAKDIIRSVENTVGYQAMLKVRSSSGLIVYNYYSESVNNSARDPIIPVLSREQSFDVLFKYDNKFKPGQEVGFQAALLYTDLNGVRKVRSINTTAAANDNIVEVFKFVNQDVVTNIMIKDILTTLGDCNFADIRKSINSKIFDIFTQYRALCGGSLGAQLVLPDSLKTLPMYMLSFQKTELMKQNKSSARGNERIFDFFKLLTYNTTKRSFKLYPQIVPLHEYLEETDLTFYDQNVQLLQICSADALAVRCGSHQLVNGGCYLIFQGETAYLWFNENTNELLLHDLLGSEGPYNHIEIMGGVLPPLDTDINRKAHNVLRNWQQLTLSNYIPVVPLRPNVDPYYSSAMNRIMVEDKSIELVEDLDSYLIHLHRNIKENMDNDRYVKLASSSDGEHESFAQKYIQF